MSNEVANVSAMESVIMQGDLSKLSPQQRVEYMAAVCKSVGLNPLTKPFEYITLNGKLTMYARKDCTDQLRSVRKVSLTITARETIEGVYVVTAKAKLPDGREDESTGAVTINGLKGESLANAFMKAETKAKRRVTLSICGLGMLDEEEVATITKPMYTQPEPSDDPTEAQPDTTYRVPFGKYKNRTLEAIHAQDAGALVGYIEYLEREAQKKGETIKGVVAEFIENAGSFLGALENQAIKQLDAKQRGLDLDFNSAPN